MALPRPTLLAIAGVVLSLMSFVAMRTIAASTGESLSLPAPSAETAVDPAPAVAKNRPAPAAPATPRVEDVPAATADALARGKVVVLLFVQRGAADDDATARQFGALSGLSRRVSAFRVDIADIGRYAGVVANLGVTQAPSIVIVRPDLKAIPPIEGYVESGYLLQRVRDQLR